MTQELKPGLLHCKQILLQSEPSGKPTTIIRYHYIPICIFFFNLHFFPQEKEMKKAKWLSEEALQIAVKRREGKSKGEKESYTHLNGEFQRIARREKKAFLKDQCKEIEANNRMGKTRDLVKKIRDPKGTFHAKMGTIKEMVWT